LISIANIMFLTVIDYATVAPEAHLFSNIFILFS
jgi:hypothetical protein